MSELDSSKPSPTALSTSRRSESPAAYALELELVCQEIDAAEGDISPELMKRFEGAKYALAEKTDRWIGFLDAAAAMVEALKVRKDRAAKALKTAEALQKRLKGHVKFCMEQTPNVPFKGDSGSLYLHRNPEGVEIDFALEDKTAYKTVDSALIEMEPSLAHYVKQLNFYAIDTTKLKNDLKGGRLLSWARLSQGSHLRVKG